MLREESNPRIPRKPGQPVGSKKHSDLYTDENPKGTIHGLGFKDLAKAKASVTIIKKSGKTHAHKIQAAIAMEQRARVAGKTKEAAVYRKFIEQMKKKTKEMNEDLRQWFSKTHPKGDWVRIGLDGEIKGPCAREEGEGKPKCLNRSRAERMTKAERAKAARRKRRKDPVADRKGKGGKPINVKTESYDTEELKKVRKMLTGEQPEPKPNAMTVKELIKMHKALHKPANVNKPGPYDPVVKEEYLIEKNVPTNPKLWSQAKALAKKKFDVYPSAYANGWAAKWYKKRGGGWKTLKEERQSTMKTTKDLFLEQLDIAQYGHIVEKDDGKDHEYEMARRQLATAATAIKRLMEKLGQGEGNLQAWVQSKLTKASDYIDSVADYMDAKDPVVKEAVELSNQVKEYIGEEDYRERTSKRNQQLTNIAYSILKRNPKSGVTIQKFPSLSPVFLETVHGILEKHKVHHGDHEKAVNHPGVTKDIEIAHEEHLELRGREDDYEKEHYERAENERMKRMKSTKKEETEVQYMVDKEGHKLDGQIIESYEIKSNGRVKVKTASGTGYIKEEDIVEMNLGKIVPIAAASMMAAATPSSAGAFDTRNPIEVPTRAFSDHVERISKAAKTEKHMKTLIAKTLGKGNPNPTFRTRYPRRDDNAKPGGLHKFVWKGGKATVESQ